MSSKKLSKSIIVTHFVNPHLFWYHSTDVPNKEYSQIVAFESEIGAFLKKMQPVRPYQPKIGDKVAVHFLPWKKYIRCYVQDIGQSINLSYSYIVWAMDYGFPIETKLENIRVLPDHYKEDIDHVRCGGLANVMPAEKGFDFIKICPTVATVEDWSKRACEIFEKLISDAASIIFVELFVNSTPRKQNWGYLNIQNHSGLNLRIKDCLIDCELAKGVESNFIELCPSLKSAQKSPWLTNDLTTNYKVNTLNMAIVQAAEHNCQSEISCDFAKQKVEAWHERNMRYKDASFLESQTNSLSSEDDIQFDDSVSNTQENGVGLGGALSKTLKTKYYNGKTPPKPRVEDFKILLNKKGDAPIAKSTENAASKISETSTSAHRKNAIRKYQECLKLETRTRDQDYSSNVHHSQESSGSEISANGLLSPAALQKKNRRDHLRELRRASAAVDDIFFNFAQDGFSGSPALTSTPTTHDSKEKAIDLKASVVSPKLKRRQLLAKLFAQEYDKEDQDEPSKTSDHDKEINAAASTGSNSTERQHSSKFDDSQEDRSEVQMKSKRSQYLKELRAKHLNESLCTNSSAKPMMNSKELEQEPSQSLMDFAKNKAILFRKPPIVSGDDSDTYFEYPDMTSKHISATQAPKIAFNGLPAGYDMSKLSEYHEETVHWHRKATTRYDKAPQNRVKSEYKQVIVNIGKQTYESVKDQNFRHTRPHTDKYKRTNAEIEEVEMPDSGQSRRSNVCPEDSKAHSSLEITPGSGSFFDSSCETDTTVHLVNHLREDICETSKFLRNMDDYVVLAHSKIMCKPTDRMPEVFIPAIENAMHKLNLKKTYRLQAYAWPVLQANKSLFIVNPNNTGRTWCYIPAICNRIRFSYTDVPQTYGPLVIMVVATSKHVEQVAFYCKRLLSDNMLHKVVAAFGMRNLVDAKVQLLDSCNILVATPGSLFRILEDNKKDPLIDPNRLQYLIIDDIDLMLARTKDAIDAVMKDIFKMVKKPKLEINLVVVSREWDSSMKSLLQHTSNSTLLIGDFLQAAVYGSVNISIMMCPHEEKITAVMKLIKEHSLPEQHFIILCNNDEDVCAVDAKLNDEGINHFSYTSTSTMEDLDLIQTWKQGKDCDAIVVCTDNDLPELGIKTARVLIHYSMPQTWTRFTKRFSLFAHSIENYVANDFQPSELGITPLKSLILLDEDNSLQLPRLVDFLKKQGNNNCVPMEVLTVSKNVSLELEKNRPLLCPYLLEFGECDQPRCRNRHTPLRSDSIKEFEDVPTSGDLRISVLQVLSPTYYTVRLLHYKPKDGKQWQDVHNSSSFATFGMRLNLHYSNCDNWALHWPIKLKDMCIFKMDDQYHRAQILEIVKVSKRTTQVTLMLIDVGMVVSAVNSNVILAIEDKFKEFPPQAFHIRLLGVVPYDGECSWDKHATKVVQQWIRDGIKKNDVIQVSITMVLSNIIWVNNLVVMERLSTVGQYVYRINLKHSLLEKNFGLRNNENSIKIRALVEEYQLLHIKDESVLDDQSREIDADVCEDLIKFTSDSSIQDVSTNLINFTSSDADDDSVLIKQKNFKTQEGALATPQSVNIQDDRASAAEEEEDWDKLVNHDKTKELYVPLPVSKDDSLDNKNAAINRSDVATAPTSTPKQEWCYLTLDKLVKVNIIDYYCDWKSIFLYRLDNIKQEQEEELDDLIQEHVENTKVPAKPIREKDLCPYLDCIYLDAGKYHRAKIYAIYRSGVDRICRILLCDNGKLITCNFSDLEENSLLESTEDIIEFMPFQAIHCTLAGIVVSSPSPFYELTAKALYAYGVRECRNTPSVIKDLQTHSYEILLYEWDENEDFKLANLINRSFLDIHGATLDENTKDDLDIKVCRMPLEDEKEYEDEEVNEKLISLNAEGDEGPRVVSFEELLQCIEKHFELEAEFRGGDNKLQITELTQEEQPRPICDAKAKDVQELKNNFNDSQTEKGKRNVLTDVNSIQPEDSYDRPPPLKCLHKRPVTTWYQTEFFIGLCINAPDVEDYYLEVKQESLIFFAMINQDAHALFLKFMGTIEPETVSHGVRGLQVVVCLRKSVPMKWPRLIEQTQKFPWLTYNMETFLNKELDQLLSNQELPTEAEFLEGRLYNNNYNSDDENDEHLIDNLTPIINSDEMYDPMAESF